CRTSRLGRPSWPANGARPWWSAIPATKPSTPTLSPSRYRSSESHILGNGSVWFGGGPRGKGVPPGEPPRRAAYPVAVTYEQAPRHRPTGEPHQRAARG